jgi:GNAT superfamily N-acetyltransferase
MAEVMLKTPRAVSVAIRSYRPTDHRDCRQLWAELTEEHRALYENDQSPTGIDPGAAFEEYLTRLDLSGMWVADDPGVGVVGLVGLLLDGRGGEVQPVVVTTGRRGQGIGRALLGHVADQARRRGLRQLTIAPASRNIDAIRCLHAAGYDALASITLAIDLSPRAGRGWRDGIDLHDLRFQY